MNRDEILFWHSDFRPSTTSSERYFRPIILESALSDHPESLKRHPLVQMPSINSHLPCSSILSTISTSQNELFSAFTSVPPSKQATLNTKKFSYNHHLADQSSSSADSGVHSSFTQSPITKHSFRKSVLSFPSSLLCNWNLYFLDVNHMDSPLIVHRRSLWMRIPIPISMQPMISISLVCHRMNILSMNNIR